NTVVTDPAKLDDVLKTVDDAIHAQVDSSPNLRGAKAKEFEAEMSGPIKQSLASEAAKSAIMKSSDPVGTAQTFAARYPTLIGGADELAQAKQAQSQQKFNAAQDKALMVAQKQLDKQNADKTATGLLASLI